MEITRWNCGFFDFIWNGRTWLWIGIAIGLSGVGHIIETINAIQVDLFGIERNATGLVFWLQLVPDLITYFVVFYRVCQSRR